MCNNLRKYKYLHRKCCERETIIAAWHKLRKGKTKRIEVRVIEADFESYVDKMQLMLQNTRPGGDPDLQFWPDEHKPRTVFEHGKERTIYCPSIWEQWVHHIAVQVLAPIVTRHAYPYSCGSMPKRGGVYGKRYLERLARRGFKYFAKLDIRHFFNSIRPEIMIRMLEELIADDWYIYLIRRIFSQFPRGLPLGFYPSQWLANFVLYKMDWRIAAMQPVGYIRYVDDLVIVGNNKRQLHRIVAVIRQELGRMRLRLKDNDQICRFIYRTKGGRLVGRTIDYMGFVFRRRRTVLRRKIMLRMTRCARRLRRADRISARRAASMISRLGWLKHTDTALIWYRHIKPNINVKVLKGIVRKESKANADRMERGTEQRTACALCPA